MLEWDHDLFFLLNTTLSHPFLDQVLPVLTDLHKVAVFRYLVFPALLIVWFVKDRKKMPLVLLGLAITVGAVDNFNYRILKAHFQRPRPPVVEKNIMIRSERYAGYSFPSNHAANNFAGATFLSFCYPALTPVFYGFAALVAYSRVYVGVHYPLDVAAGALLGCLFGLLFFKFLLFILQKLGRSL